jgi:hypothetical protein
MKKRTERIITIAKIDPNNDTQIRSGLNDAVVDEYIDAIKNGAAFPPIIVFQNNSKADYYLADGWHRVEAFRKAKKTKIKAVVYSGNLRDAILFAAGANAEHGLRRDQGDVKRAVEKLLKDNEWAEWTNQAIASVCRCTAQYVAVVRRKFEHAKPDSVPYSHNSRPILKTVRSDGTIRKYKSNKRASNPVEKIRKFMENAHNLLAGRDQITIERGINAVKKGLGKLEKLQKPAK